MMHMDLAFYRQILEESFPHIDIHSLSSIQTGWNTLVLVINDEHIFRFPRRPENEAQLEKEMELLPLLVDLLPLPVPQVDETFRRRGRFYHTIASFYGIRYALTMADETLLKSEIACLSQNLRV